MDKINEQTDKNLNKLQKSHKKLDDVIQREQKIGFFRLLMMAILALILFIFTMGVIFLDRTLSGIALILFVVAICIMGAIFLKNTIFGRLIRSG